MFVFFGVVKFGCIGEILCCVVVVVWTISSFMKCDGVWISCCVRFLVPSMTVEFKLLFRVSGKNVLYFNGVASMVSGTTFT